MSKGMSSIIEISKDAKAWPFIEAKKIIKKSQANNKQKIRYKLDTVQADYHILEHLVR